MSERNNNGEGFLMGLILGAILGGGLFYFLTSTKEGSKVKEQIREKAEDALAELNDLVKEIEGKSKEFKKKIEETQKQLEIRKNEMTQEIREKFFPIEKFSDGDKKVAPKFFYRHGRPLNW